MKIDYEMLGFVIIIAIAMVSITVLDVFAVTIQSVIDLKHKWEDIENSYLEKDDEIRDKKNEIIRLEKQLENDKTKLREVKKAAGQDWDSISQIGIQEKVIRETEQEIRTANAEYITLLNETSQLRVDVKDLRLQYQKDREALQIKQREALDKLTKVIGIEISRNCITLHKLNMTTNCPTYLDLIQLDSSNREISGNFVWKDGWYQREKSPVRQSWKFYDFEKDFKIIIDPPAGMSEKIKMITISNNFGIYLTATDLKMDNNVRTYHHDRYIDKCYNARISTNSWEDTLLDTIYTLRNQCTISVFKEITVEEIKKTVIEIKSSPNWQYEQWVKESKEKCKGECWQY